MKLKLPPRSPKELLKEAEERFQAAVRSLKAMPADTPAGLLAYLYAAGVVAATMTDDLYRVTHERRYGMKMLHDLAKGLGETRPTLFACAALCRSYSADETDEIAGRARSMQELADLVCLEDPEADKRLRRRLLNARPRARRGRSTTGRHVRQALRRQAGQDDRGNGDVAGV